MKKIEIEKFLLKLIQHDGNITPLVDLGYDYSDIIKMISDLLERHLILATDEGLVISEEGKDHLIEIETSLEIEGKDRWIEPEHQSKVRKLKENEIYLPELDELWNFD